MGGSASKEIGVNKATNSNGEKISLLVEICSSWGYGSKVGNVKSTLIKELNNQGYDVEYNFEPQNGANGEYYIYAIKNGNKECVFSNSKKIGDGNTVIGSKINDKNLMDIVQNCLRQ